MVEEDEKAGQIFGVRFGDPRPLLFRHILPGVILAAAALAYAYLFSPSRFHGFINWIPTVSGFGAFVFLVLLFAASMLLRIVSLDHFPPFKDHVSRVFTELHRLAARDLNKTSKGTVFAEESSDGKPLFLHGLFNEINNPAVRFHDAGYLWWFTSASVAFWLSLAIAATWLIAVSTSMADPSRWEAGAGLIGSGTGFWLLRSKAFKALDDFRAVSKVAMRKYALEQAPANQGRSS